MNYRSVVVSGTAEPITDQAEEAAALHATNRSARPSSGWGRLVAMAPSRARDLLALTASVLAVATTVTTFAGWGTSGERTRTSYELVEAADRAGVLDDGVAWAAPLWFLVPAACGLALVAFATRRHVTAGLAATTLGALVGTGAVLVDRSPLVAEPAVGVAVVLGTGTALSGVAVLVTARKETAG
jgi:hypothetical protein